jgi:hypothetical protein
MHEQHATVSNTVPSWDDSHLQRFFLLCLHLSGHLPGKILTSWWLVVVGYISAVSVAVYNGAVRLVCLLDLSDVPDWFVYQVRRSMQRCLTSLLLHKQIQGFWICLQKVHSTVEALQCCSAAVLQ